MDSSIYLVETAQFRDLNLQKQNFLSAQPSAIFLLDARRHARSRDT